MKRGIIFILFLIISNVYAIGISPSEREIQFTAVENLPKNMQTTGIAARTSSTSYLKVFVPYPGKYAELSFKVNNANINEPVIFNILIKNLGKEAIQSAHAAID